MQEPDDQFKMVCPKCGSNSFTVRRDQRAYVHKSQPFELVFSCRCGKQLFGDTIQEEYDRQKVEWEARPPEPGEAEPDEAELRRIEQERRQEQLKKAMEYQRIYLAERRRKQAEEERKRKEAEDRRWRERVARVEQEHGADTTYLKEVGTSRKSKPIFTTREPAKPAVAKSKPAPAATTAKTKAPPKAAKPKPAPAAAKPTAAPSAPKVIEFDASHPHAEFMALLAEGTFHEHFPDCIPPDVKSPDLCVWPPCEKPRRKKSKYCSRECSNRNARWRHKMRKKS